MDRRGWFQPRTAAEAARRAPILFAGSMGSRILMVFRMLPKLRRPALSDAVILFRSACAFAAMYAWVCVNGEAWALSAANLWSQSALATLLILASLVGLTRLGDRSSLRTRRRVSKSSPQFIRSLASCACGQERGLSFLASHALEDSVRRAIVLIADLGDDRDGFVGHVPMCAFGFWALTDGGPHRVGLDVLRQSPDSISP